jgi:hypothetical protein
MLHASAGSTSSASSPTTTHSPSAGSNGLPLSQTFTLRKGKGFFIRGEWIESHLTVHSGAIRVMITIILVLHPEQYKVRSRTLYLSRQGLK